MREPETALTELRGILLLHAERYPMICPTDAVKLIYQNEFGGGHLIPDPAASLERLRREFSGITRDLTVPLLEEIGNGMVRVMLAALDEASYPLERLNRDFVRSAAEHRGSMLAFLEKLDVLRALACDGLLPFSAGELETYLRPYSAAGYPAVSHSEAYRSAYRPSYRVVLKRLLHLDEGGSVEKSIAAK